MQTRQSLLAFMEQEYSPENFDFLASCNHLTESIATRTMGRDILSPEQHEALQTIMQDFLDVGSRCEVNIKSHTRRDVCAAWKQVDNEPLGGRNYVPLYYHLDQAVHEILGLVGKDTLPRHIKDQESKRGSASKGGRSSDHAAGQLQRGEFFRWPPHFLNSEATARYANKLQAQEIAKLKDPNKHAKAQEIAEAQERWSSYAEAFAQLNVYGAEEAAIGIDSSSSSSSSVVYGNASAFDTACQAFIDETSLSNLAEIVLHLNAPHLEFRRANEHTLTAVRAKLVAWQGGKEPSKEEMDELETLVIQMQQSAAL